MEYSGFHAESNRTYNDNPRLAWLEYQRHQPDAVEPYAANIQRQADATLADYGVNIYARGWVSLWIFNLTHWIASEEETAHEALCELARLRKAVAV